MPGHKGGWRVHHLHTAAATTAAAKPAGTQAPAAAPVTGTLCVWGYGLDDARAKARVLQQAGIDASSVEPGLSAVAAQRDSHTNAILPSVGREKRMLFELAKEIRLPCWSGKRRRHRIASKSKQLRRREAEVRGDGVLPSNARTHEHGQIGGKRHRDSILDETANRVTFI